MIIHECQVVGSNRSNRLTGHPVAKHFVGLHVGVDDILLHARSVHDPHYWQLRRNISSIFSNNSEAFTSELPKNV